jgi:murein L,D-transpeptidase YcbB/YkuD
VSWLCNPSAKVSAHYVVSGSSIHQLVPENRKAWHAAGGNDDSIGIECDPRQQDSTYASVAALIREIRRRHGDLPLVRHRDVKGSFTECPGTYDLARLDRLARSGGSAAPAKESGKIDEDGRLGTETVKELQRALGVKADGRACESTWTALQAFLGTPKDGAVSHQSYRAEELGNGVVDRCWRFTGRGSKGSKMVEALQLRLGVKADGVWFESTTLALQKRLNTGRL